MVANKSFTHTIVNVLDLIALFEYAHFHFIVLHTVNEPTQIPTRTKRSPHPGLSTRNVYKQAISARLRKEEGEKLNGSEMIVNRGTSESK